MVKVTRYMPELRPKRIKKNIKKFWKIYINPPKEKKIYLKPDKLPVIAAKVDEKQTKGQPKQVVYDKKTGLAFVSCMNGHALQVFKVTDTTVTLEDEVSFDDQCVEVLLYGDYVLVTTTNFARPPQELHNKLWILDIKTRKIVSSMDTGGNWSKLIAVNPKAKELLISNWHSHNISVVDVTDIKKPKLKQVLKWGEAPRGIAFTPDGTQAVVTGFYSGNLGILEKKPGSKEWESVYTGESFDKPHYSGNMRHVLIEKSGKRAIVSNLGRNMIHIWSIPKREFIETILVGKAPNSIDWVDDREEEIVASCRESDFVYRIDLKKKEVVGRSGRTGSKPTGLCSVKDGFLVTGFDDATLELYKYI